MIISNYDVYLEIPNNAAMYDVSYIYPFVGSIYLSVLVSNRVWKPMGAINQRWTETEAWISGD